MTAKAGYLMVVLLPWALSANDVVETRRANMTGSRGDQGKCTIEVRVDVTAEVEIFGDTGRLRTLAGQPAQWVRLECTDRMPPNPADFRFHGIDGRGNQQLVADPRSNRGVAVVRIDDPKSGSEGYTFDLEWSGTGGGYRPPYPEGGRPGNAFTADQALRICQDSVRDKARGDYGFRDIEFTNVAADNNPGRHDWVVGSFRGERERSREQFNFSCAVDFDSGRVRNVEINRAGGGGSDRPGPPPGAFSGAQAIRVCQDAVTDRIRSQGFTDVNFLSTRADDNPGRHDWVVGQVRGRRGDGDRAIFDFSCSVDFGTGRVRSIDVRRK
jgi:hypothetical protein